MIRIIRTSRSWWIVISVASLLLLFTIRNAEATDIPPDESIVGPRFCPQVEIRCASTCSSDEVGAYQLELAGSATPLTNRNFVPCKEGAIDSYFPPNAQQVKITNLGEVEIVANFVCD